jgi:alkylation response protein AidB-like acyl-CoA dehydrogenase
MRILSAVEAATALAPRVAELAELGESERRLPDELVAEFGRSGLFSLCIPTALGGGEVPVGEMLRAVEIIATADAAAAWCVMIQATSGVVGAYLAADAAAEVFGNGEAILGGVYAPLGRAVAEEGGYRVSGRWPFASGSGHCTWLLGGAVVEDGPPRLMLFPASEVTIHDTWHVSGLAGTGSNDIEVSDVFVPGCRSLVLSADRPREQGPLYKFPVFGFLALGIAAVALGIGRGAIGDLLDLAGSKTPTGSRRKLAERQVVQMQVAQSEAILAGARAFLLDSVAQAWEVATRGGELTVEHRARLRLAATHATTASAQVVDAMYTAGGGTSIYRASTLQRRFRDVHAATQHVMVAPATYELAGRILLGLETDTSTL